MAIATTTLPAELKAIADLYESADYTDQIDGLYDDYEAFKLQQVAERQTLARYGDNTLLDRDTVLEQLGVLYEDIRLVLTALHQQMLNDSKTVTRCTVTLGALSPHTSNIGNGTVLTTKVLDGYNPPIVGALSHIRYLGLDSELAVTSETMALECTADSMRDGLSEGAEVFSWKGGIKDPELHYQDEGSGDGPSVTVAQGSTLITDGGFENWTNTNTPSNFDVDNGTAGTHILRNSTVANLYRGTYSMQFAGTGAQATIGVSQTLSVSSLRNRRRYCVCARIKASAVPAAGQIEIHFAGTGYTKTAPTAEVQTVQISGTPTGGSYTLTYTGPPHKTQTTGAIAFNASSATVQTALRALTGLESVVVTTSAGSVPDITHAVTFRGVPGNVAQLTSTSSLTGGTPVITHATTTAGVEGDCIILPAAAFPTTFGLYWFFINLPNVLPTDWEIVAQITSTLSNTVNVYFDDLTLKEVDYHGGVGAVVVAGSTRFLAGDRITFTCQNDNSGVFSRYFRRKYQFQLPSAASGNIADALAS